MYIGSRHRKINRISPSNIFSKDCRGFQFFEAVRKSLGNSIPIIVEDLSEVTREVFQLRDHFQFYGIRILQMGFYTYPDNIYTHHITIFQLNKKELMIGNSKNILLNISRGILYK